MNAVFTAGNRLSREFFPQYVDAIHLDNKETLAARASNTSILGAKRTNRLLLRQLSPVAIGNGWLSRSQEQDDDALYQLWGDIASGKKITTKPALTDENLSIVKSNWEILSANSPVFDYSKLPDLLLLKLIPQGVPSNPVYLPSPDEALTAGWQDFMAPRIGENPTMLERYGYSLRIILFGFLWSCIVGVPLGILCGVYDFFARLIEPFVDFFRYMPAPTFSTLLVAVLSAHDAPKVALVFLGTVFQMVLVVSKTTRLLDPALLEAAQTLGTKPSQMITKVVLPGILPNLYNDLRILLGWAWTWLVIAELIGVKSGLTGFIDTQGTFRNFDRVFPIIILIGVTGFVTDQLLAMLHGLFFPWAGKSGPLSRAVASAVVWPVRSIVTLTRRINAPSDLP
ncbi:MAG: ABC transporter permease, partial [Gloeobacteraceae cyanobacterium ES-bin-144]|nr:ABC transporter permease [Verrucomicrobiales bacterium]